MKTLREQMNAAMILRGFAARTQKSYLAAVRALAKHYRRSPDTLSAQEVEAYHLHLIVERKLAYSSVKQSARACHFLFDKVLRRATIHAATATARNAKHAPKKRGSRHEDGSCCRCCISIWHPPCLIPSTDWQDARFGQRQSQENDASGSGRVHRAFHATLLPRGFKRIRHYGLLGPAHKAANLAAASAALEATVPDPIVVESVEAFMRRVAGIEWLNCPHCGEGVFRVAQATPPHMPRAPP